MKEESVPLLDAIDMEILMHRDAHFGGNFAVMLEYYENEGVGVMPDFEEARIGELAHIEKEMNEDLSDVILPETARLNVEKSKQLYQDLREVYEQEPVNQHAIMVSNLILSEEPMPQEEMDVLVHEGQEMVPLLIDLIGSESFYDPLYPGYGRAPTFAAKVLGDLGDERAIPTLFSALGRESFFTDEAMIKALKALGEKSKRFLIKALRHEPLSKNNEHAAICLLEFTDDPEVSSHCLEMLKNEAARKRETFAAYLTFGCSGLEKDTEFQAFKDIMAQVDQKSDLYREMQSVLNNLQ